ncbi:amino acid ABC transporter permease [Salinarimonas sp.]|uniref:amino acid ABC transporter permease n=1 Tax=Salinarimonas sp. TaxID=2766526 RepID=UPI00391905FC
MTTTALEAATTRIAPAPGGPVSPPPAEPLAPPRRAGALRRVLWPYVNTPLNALITLVCLALLVRVGVVAYDWLYARAVFVGDPQDCRAAAGACWPFVVTKLRFMVFGFYPYDEHWRPALSLTIFLATIGVSMVPRFWSRRLVWLWAGSIATMAVLMLGGVFGLAYVSTTRWGGLPLSFMLSFVGLAVGFVFGIVLALARMSSMPAIRIMAIVFIEVVRGVPLISILFMATVMLPLFMPDGVTIDKLLRAQVAIIIFAAAYIAETVRGGLQAIPKGQREACGSLGMTYFQAMRLVILPQALKIVIPPLVTIFIGFFQDTTLVTIIGLLDFLDTVRASMRDPDWQGIAVLEGYVFAGFVYFVFSYCMGAYSRWLERRLRTGHA